MQLKIERLIAEIRLLAEGLVKLREDFNKMLKVIEGLQRDYRAIERRLEESFLSLNEAMIRGFGELIKRALLHTNRE